MKLIVWPIGEQEYPEVHELSSFQELWAIVRAGQDAGGVEHGYIRELSANEDEQGAPYLVLSWVEVQED